MTSCFIFSKFPSQGLCICMHTYHNAAVVSRSNSFEKELAVDLFTMQGISPIHDLNANLNLPIPKYPEVTLWEMTPPCPTSRRGISPVLARCHSVKISPDNTKISQMDRYPDLIVTGIDEEHVSEDSSAVTTQPVGQDNPLATGNYQKQNTTAFRKELRALLDGVFGPKQND